MVDMTLRVDTSRLKWFADSPDAGPDCICSLCDQPILEPEIPIRLLSVKTPHKDTLEARLHANCWNEVSPDKIQTFDDDEETVFHYLQWPYLLPEERR